MLLAEQLKIENLRKKNIHIVGLSGAEGAAVVEFLWRRGVRKITAHDFAPKEQFAKNFRLFHLSLTSFERKDKLDFLLSLPIEIHYQDTYLQDIEKAQAVFTSSGWFKHKANFPKLKKLFDQKIPFHNTIQLYFQYCRGTIIAVTGSNGKSTTTALINHILRESGRNVYWAGNSREGKQTLDKIEDMSLEDFLVLEVSERQLLADIPKGPQIGVITNISPNHLDDHKTMENYIAVKKRLFAHQKETDYAVINYDNEITRKFLLELKSQKFIFTEKAKLPKVFWGSYQSGDRIFYDLGKGPELICAKKDLQIFGRHNHANAQAASLACGLAGLKAEEINSGLKKFKGLQNRLQKVLTIFGVEFYDDIQSTTPQSTEAALEIFQQKIYLVAGGENKGMDYEKLASLICEKVKTLFLVPGSGTEELKAKIKKNHSKLDSSFKIVELDSFKEILRQIKNTAKEGDVVLFSPACAGFQSHFLGNKSIKTWVEEVF